MLPSTSPRPSVTGQQANGGGGNSDPQSTRFAFEFLDEAEALEFEIDHSRAQLPEDPTRKKGRRRDLFDRGVLEERELNAYLEAHDSLIAALPAIDRNTTIAMVQMELGQSRGKRPRWRSKGEYLLACIGYAIGLGNVWRFPYLAYESRGSFFVQYLIISLLFGLPMFVLESAIGQQMQMGYVRSWRAINSRLSGLGVSSCILCCINSVYYNVLNAWALYYFASSFRKVLPWTIGGLNAADSGRKFWVETVLRKGHRMTDFSGVNRTLILCIAIAWILTYLMVWKGLLGNRRMIFITSLFPTLLFVCLLIRALTLPGAGEGLRYFFTPTWESLLDISAWTTAGSQMFFTLGIGWGGLINYASFNPYKNNFYKDAAIVVGVNAVASMLCGTVFFSVVGFMAHSSTLSLNEVAKAGTGAPFLVYSVGIGQMPASVLFSIVFWLMFILLGLSSQFQIIEVIMTGLIEMAFFRHIKKWLLAMLLCSLFFVCGQIYVTSVGIYWMNLTDAFTGSIALYVVTLVEVLAIVYFYGSERFAQDCYEMTGKRISYMFKWILRCFQPLLQSWMLLMCVAVFAVVNTDRFVEQQRESVKGDGCGDNNCGHDAGHGTCSADMFCECSPGWGGTSCETKLADPAAVVCPENCNGRGICQDGHCLCFTGFYGGSCRGDLYVQGWPSWAHFLGWIFAVASLIPLPLIVISRRIRRRMKRRMDGQDPRRRKKGQLPPSPIVDGPGLMTRQPRSYRPQPGYYIFDESSDDDDLLIDNGAGGKKPVGDPIGNPPGNIELNPFDNKPAPIPAIDVPFQIENLDGDFYNDDDNVDVADRAVMLGNAKL